MVAVNGRPQPLTWNIGTTVHSTSRWPIARPSVMAEASECSTIARWEYTTPLGRPVVPEV